jgi:hypothetical protein
MPDNLSRRVLVEFIFVGVIAGVLASCSGPPPTVERITISNPTGYDLEVQVSDPNRDSWLPTGIVEAGSEQISEQVIDQGEVWIFRFLHWGESVGELELTRSELERNGWRLEVPGQVEERLRQWGRLSSEEFKAS